MNKKGMIDFPILTFIGIALVLLIIGLFTYFMVNTILTPFQASLGNVTIGGAEGAQAVGVVQARYNSFWEFAILFAFLIQIILMFISAFLIDVHPLFLVLYIILGLITFIFAPEVFGAIDRIYESPQFATSVAHLQYLDFIRTNFGIICVALMILTGIIIFAKLKFFPSNRGT